MNNTEAERVAQAEYLLDHAANLISEGKHITVRELSGLLRICEGVHIPKAVLEQVATVLEEKVGRGRRVSLKPSVEQMFRDPEIRKRYLELELQLGTTNAASLTAKEFNLSSVRKIVKNTKQKDQRDKEAVVEMLEKYPENKLD